MIETNPIDALASVAAIIALTNLAKTLGIKGRWAALAAIITGILLNLAIWAWGDTAAFQAGARGLLYGLAAAGLWDMKPTNSPTPDAQPETAGVAPDLEAVGFYVPDTTPEIDTRPTHLQTATQPEN